jgi:hypothetical protein
VFGMRGWLFGAFRQLLREEAAAARDQPYPRARARGLRTAS